MVKECICLSAVASLLLSVGVRAGPATNPTLAIQVRVQNIIVTNAQGSPIASGNCGALFVASSVGSKPITVTQAMASSVWGADFQGRTTPSSAAAQLETLTFTTDELQASNRAVLESFTACK